jgi:hypothetical protein
VTARKAAAAPTSPSAWKLPQPRLFELPSGNSMRLRPGPCMGRLVREGLIPNPLLGATLETAAGGVPEIDWKQREQDIAAIVCALAVDPQVTMDGAEGTVPYEALAEMDVEFIAAVAQEGTPDLARFRGK